MKKIIRLSLALPAFFLLAFSHQIFPRRQLFVQWGITALFALLASLSAPPQGQAARQGRRFLSFLPLTLGVTFFSLLAPEGRLLFHLAAFPITAGALQAGLSRSALLTGTSCISAYLQPLLPAASRGSLIADVFCWWEKLAALRPSLQSLKQARLWHRDGLINALDSLLLQVWAQGDKNDSSDSRRQHHE